MNFQGFGKQTRTPERRRNNHAAPSNQEQELLLLYSLLLHGGGPLEQAGGRRVGFLPLPPAVFHDGDQTNHDVDRPGRQRLQHHEEALPEPRMFFRTPSISGTPPSRESILHDIIDRALVVLHDDDDELLFGSEDATMTDEEDVETSSSSTRTRGTQDNDEEDPSQH
jgi:hypothetical protein